MDEGSLGRERHYKVTGMDLGCGMYVFWLLRSKSLICELQMASYRASIRS
jgi:hypothetical protein